MPPRVRSCCLDSAQQLDAQSYLPRDSPSSPGAMIAVVDPASLHLTARRESDGSAGPANVGGAAFGVTAGACELHVR